MLIYLTMKDAAHAIKKYKEKNVLTVEREYKKESLRSVS